MFLDQFSTRNRIVTMISSHSIALRSNLSKLVTAKGAALYTAKLPGGLPPRVTPPWGGYPLPRGLPPPFLELRRKKG